MTPPPLRWKPDPQLADAIIAEPNKVLVELTELPDAERSYLVARLTHEGMTAEEIARKTGCSRRTVMLIRAEPATMVAIAAFEEAMRLEKDLRAERCQHSASREELAEARRREARLLMQRDQLLDQMVVEGKVRLCAKQLHPMVPYNIYRYVDRSGLSPRTREICRECSNDRVTKCRAKPKKQLSEQRCNATALQSVHADCVGSAS